jgi:hypothetical protein
MATEDIYKHLDQLTIFFKERCGSVSWKNILIVESSRLVDVRKYHINKGDLFTPEEYAPRFDWLLDQGHSWINLNAAGIFDNTLLVIVELPSYKNTTPRNLVSVNFSGPRILDEKIIWDISEFVRIIE